MPWTQSPSRLNAKTRPDNRARPAACLAGVTGAKPLSGRHANVAAHPTDEVISREDAEDLRSFAHAIVEYAYDLTDRYNEFKARIAVREGKKKKNGK